MFVKSKLWYVVRGIGGRQKHVKGVLTLAGQGAVAADIPASTFGLTTIEGASILVREDNAEFYLAAPTFDGSALLVVDDNAGVLTATDATGEFAITVWGR